MLPVVPDCCAELQEAEAGARGPGPAGDPPAQEASQTGTRHQPKTCQVGLFLDVKLLYALFCSPLKYLLSQLLSLSLSQSCVFLL